MAQQLQDGNTVAIQGFGTFEVRKKLERISINPATPTTYVDYLLNLVLTL